MVGVTDSDTGFGRAVAEMQTAPDPQVLIICEHASNHIPEGLDGLGLSPQAQISHVAWDPGALGVARALAELIPAVLVEGCISRLVYDCNRPPDAPSAIPERSEIYDIPGNCGLTEAARAARVAGVYDPFHKVAMARRTLHQKTLRLLVTIHSFTPVYNGTPRSVEIGVLHGRDARFAGAMMKTVPDQPAFCTRLNEPYAASDGVAHTLDLHGAELPSVMIEIRNDLIATPPAQAAMARHLAAWIGTVLEDMS